MKYVSKCRICGLNAYSTDSGGCCICGDCSAVIIPDDRLPDGIISGLTRIPAPSSDVTDQYDLGGNIRLMLDCIQDNDRSDDPEGYAILDLLGGRDDLVSYIVSRVDNDDLWGGVKTALIRAYYAGAAAALNHINHKED